MASPSPQSSPAPPSWGLARVRRNSDSSHSNRSTTRADTIPQTLWRLQVPLYITHASQPPNTPPFVTTVPRLSYLALLVPRLSVYFGGSLPCSSFHHEEVQLRNLPVGLLVDLYQPQLPWKLVVGDGPEWEIGDTFMNSAKEADFVRNGNAKQIMSLSKENTTALWNAVLDNDYVAFTKINYQLLSTSTPLKHVPVRIYIPSSPSKSPPAVGAESGAGSFKVIQALVPPLLPNRTQQTLGVALKTLLPALFPSSRDPVLANVILHGSPVPFKTPLEELMREAAYPDGWLCLIVVLL
ncbi:autophagy protein Apg5-domain-containing protein [Diplogelasinospora grovesii]|uniref:Autophagy protein 5 n=1 Tax=Diplogelasinospora grovesii TaxID=303347 RepID=A0AAN6NCJ9_9PEZI|nr:autophagy protein Apg5-domain-containing protein [Diplogelasinospora grovesii]